MSERDQAIADVVTREQGKLKHFIRKWVVDEADVEDVLQDVFYELVEAQRMVTPIGALGLVVMTLWNGLLPPLFGFKTIHFWQALGLLVLSRILVGGFPRGHGHGFRHRQRMIQRWESMTPEEREKFKQGVRGRFCPPPESRKV